MTNESFYNDVANKKKTEEETEQLTPEASREQDEDWDGETESGNPLAPLTRITEIEY